MKRFGILLLLYLLFGSDISAQNRSGADAARGLPSIAEKVAGMQKFPGYFPFYWT